MSRLNIRKVLSKAFVNHNITSMRKLTKDKILNIIDSIENMCYNQCYVKHGDNTQPGDPLLKRNKLPEKPVIISNISVDLIYNATLSLLMSTYGASNEHFSNFQSQFSDYNYNTRSLEYKDILELCIAKLEFVKFQIELGLLVTIENEISAEIVSDFLLLAKKSLEEGKISVASVLCCAALEDALKRIAKSNTIETDEKTMSEVVNALKGSGLISNAQSIMLRGYTQTRNKAFHAKWEEIEKPEISAIIGYTEQLIIQFLQ